MTRISFLARIKALFSRAFIWFAVQWRCFWGLRLRYKIGIIVVLALIFFGGVTWARSGKSAQDPATDVPSVTVMQVSGISGGTDSVNILGTVQSISEANILAQTNGIVRSVNTRIGASVSAGSVIGELDNASERASVLQAQGVYDAAIAGRSITSLQAGNATGSFAEAATAARNTYRSAFTTIDTALTNNVDTLFGVSTPIGPELLINSISRDTFSRRRAALNDLIATWRSHLATADTSDPEALLNEAQTNAQTVSTFLADLNRVASEHGSAATPAQLASLATARASIDGLLASLSATRDAYEAKKTAAQVGSQQTVSSNNSTASADATVKQALGALHFAQATLEKSIIRAPIAGTINFLSIHVGDSVSALTHVATVAQNGALEIITYVSEENRNLLTVGETVTVAETYKGIITSIAPALDPVTKQIEVHIALNEKSTLVNGQSITIALPNGTASTTTKASIATSTGPLLLPLTAVKLTPSARIVFSVGTDGRLVSHTVEIGDVRGDRIEIRTALPGDLSIVTDVRGLSEGEKVKVVAAP
ncbi:HlyD family efflux transporter periplasmic adaptor subunit [Patescibacteria group bacterium]|nr:HlyD family efflux transporter periplasmic adaptor subunit [Patescibacteria group bacterium]